MSSSRFQRSDARRALGHWQRVVGHALDLAHDEGRHSIGKERGHQGQWVVSARLMPPPRRSLAAIRSQ
jgi:hypothetical protein